MKIPDEDLLAHFREKITGDPDDTSDFDFFDFLLYLGSPQNALFYARLFWPDFVEINEMVFLKETIEDDEDRRLLDEALKRFDGDKSKAERSFNLTEVPYLFKTGRDETTDEEYLVLAERLAEMWLLKLQQTFPDRKFKTQVLSAEETGDMMGFNFWTDRS